MTVYGYARVSTATQELDIQVAELKELGAEVVLSEKMTGTTNDRQALNELLSKVQRGDTLVVSKMDRLARTAVGVKAVVEEMLDKGVTVRIANMGVIEDTPIGRMMVTMLGAFSEFERDMIVERMTAGKAAARKRDGFREGRPRKYSRSQLDHAMTLLDDHSYTQVEALTGISKATLTREKRKRRQAEVSE